MLLKILVVVVAILHFYFFILEMFLWTRPKALKAFGMTPAFAEQTKTLAANQGLYNGFLTVGLFIGLLNNDVASSQLLLRFILGCIVVAGIYGGITVNRKIFIIQSIPAIFALAAMAL